MLHQTAQSCAAHEVRIARLEDDLREIKADIKAMREILSEAKGSWRTLVLIGGACSTIGAVISWAVANVTLKG
jgi:hypothetical protein